LVELLIKHAVSGGRAFFRPGFGSFGNDPGPRRGGWFLGRCSRRGRFSIGKRLFASIESGLLLGETLLIGVHSFRGQTILHLPLDLRLSFLFGLLFLAGNEKGQGSDQRENGKLLHGVIRQG
jgi:hypothetical protein